MVDREAARDALVRWFDANRRDLPWRRTEDPYAIWVSEVMLQQTRVDTVVPYYERFMARFPSARDLADADPEDVRALWSGLGYYRRASLLQRAARELVDRHEGRLPSDPQALAALPGFGPYTVGAVASFAFDRPVPALDGNVKRVLARIHAIEGPLDRSPAAPALRAEAERWVDAPRPGRTNEALMELGATVCAPRSPRCDRCPVADACEARRRGLTDRIPPPKRRAPPAPQPWTALCLWREDRVWLQRRPAGIFEGLWCLPMVEGHAAETLAALERGAAPAQPPTELGTVEHVLTHRRLQVRVFGAPGVARPDGAEAAWVQLGALERRGVPSFTAKVLRRTLPSALRARLRWRGRATPTPLFPAEEGEGGSFTEGTASGIKEPRGRGRR